MGVFGIVRVVKTNDKVVEMNKKNVELCKKVKKLNEELDECEKWLKIKDDRIIEVERNK